MVNGTHIPGGRDEIAFSALLKQIHAWLVKKSDFHQFCLAAIPCLSLSVSRQLAAADKYGRQETAAVFHGSELWVSVKQPGCCKLINHWYAILSLQQHAKSGRLCLHMIAHQLCPACPVPLSFFRRLVKEATVCSRRNPEFIMES